MICSNCHHQNPVNKKFCERCHEKLYVAKLKINFASGAEETVFLFPQDYSIGRDRSNELFIPDESISRTHAYLKYEDGKFFIKDLGSKNGTWCNHQLIHQKILENLDCLQLGSTLLYFYDDKNLPEHTFQATEEAVQEELFKLVHKRRTRASLQEVLQTLLDLAIRLLHTEVGSIYLLNPRTGKLEYFVGRNHQNQGVSESEFQANWDLLQSCKRRKTPLFLNARGAIKTMEGNSSLEKCTCLAVPILVTGRDDQQELLKEEIIGLFYFFNISKNKPITPAKNKTLFTLIDQAAAALETETLFEKVREKKRIEQELALAKKIQEKLLPATNIHLEYFEVAAHAKSCEAVGGDYFDFVPVEAKKLCVTIGDICGKGVPAALLTATLQAAIRMQLEYTHRPEQILRSVNRLLVNSTLESIFLTLFIGIFDLEKNKLIYVNAGHPSPILISKNSRLQELRSTTTAVGIIENLSEHPKEIDFQIGDFLFLYTDGLIESRNLKKEFYGRQKLFDLFNRNLISQAKKILQPNYCISIINQDIEKFTTGVGQTDDLTMLALKRTG